VQRNNLTAPGCPSGRLLAPQPDQNLSFKDQASAPTWVWLPALLAHGRSARLISSRLVTQAAKGWNPGTSFPRVAPFGRAVWRCCRLLRSVLVLQRCTGSRLEASEQLAAQLTDRRSAVAFAPRRGPVESRPQVGLNDRPNQLLGGHGPRARARAISANATDGHRRRNRSRSWRATKPNRVQPVVPAGSDLVECRSTRLQPALGRPSQLAPGELHLGSPRPGSRSSRPQRFALLPWLRTVALAASHHGFVVDDTSCPPPPHSAARRNHFFVWWGRGSAPGGACWAASARLGRLPGLLARPPARVPPRCPGAADWAPDPRLHRPRA